MSTDQHPDKTRLTLQNGKGVFHTVESAESSSLNPADKKEMDLHNNEEGIDDHHILHSHTKESVMAKEWEHMQLRNFTEAELIFDEQETKEILKFFFQADRQLIESIQITSDLRNLAQGLLVAAVDASYAMGWVEVTFRWAANPGSGLRKALQKLSRSAARYWFKNLKHDQSLIDAKIYDSVRDQLARNFRSHFRITLQAKAQGQRRLLMACVNCATPKPHDRLWG